MPKVMIADDEEAIRLLIRDILERSGDGFEIIEASNGQRVLELLPQVQPELLLLDIVMPELSGIAVCDQVRRDPNLRHTKVVLVSGKGADDMVMAGLSAGASDFITKPFSPLDLLSRVRKVLRDEVPVG